VSDGRFEPINFYNIFASDRHDLLCDPINHSLTYYLIANLTLSLSFYIFIYMLVVSFFSKQSADGEQILEAFLHYQLLGGGV